MMRAAALVCASRGSSPEALARAGGSRRADRRGIARQQQVHGGDRPRRAEAVQAHWLESTAIADADVVATILNAAAGATPSQPPRCSYAFDGLRRCPEPAVAPSTASSRAWTPAATLRRYGLLVPLSLVFFTTLEASASTGLESMIRVFSAQSHDRADPTAIRCRR
jgi:hypothetical protein